MENLKEALKNGWNDRIFQHYRELVNPEAVRPQNEYSQEWNDIVGTLRGLVEEKPKKVKSNDVTGSIRN